MAFVCAGCLSLPIQRGWRDRKRKNARSVCLGAQFPGLASLAPGFMLGLASAISDRHPWQVVPVVAEGGCEVLDPWLH